MDRLRFLLDTNILSVVIGHQTEAGKPIGIEITAPGKVTIADINAVLASVDAPVLTAEDIAPLRAA